MSTTKKRIQKYQLISIGIISILVIAYTQRKRITKITMQTINFIKQKTWDIYTDRRINTLHPIIRAKAKEFIIRAEQELGIKLRISSALRTWEEQTELYNEGRTNNNKIVTNARAGESYHNYGLAFDVVEIKNGRAIWDNPNWNKIAKLGKSLGFEWGGDWRKPDKPHFQITFGAHHTELAEMYRKGNRNGEYINIV